MMFSFTAAANYISRRADPVADLDCGPYVPGPIGPSVILNAYNVYLFAYSVGVKLTLLSHVALELMEKRRVDIYILTVCKIRGIAVVRPGSAIAL